MAVADHFDAGREANWGYAKGLGRALAGAALFSLPILMTMEMWWLGFYLEPAHLLQFLLFNLVLLVGLSSVSGFEPTQSWADDVLDALAAYAVAVFWSALILSIFGVISADQPLHEVLGKVVLQSVPSSFGAMLAGKQLGNTQKDPRAERERASYSGQLLLMIGGALFLEFTVAPTDEMILISAMMSPEQSAVLVLLSIAMLHGIVYTVGFKGEERPPGPTTFWSVFLRFTIVGYAIAAVVAWYLLWTFGRVQGTDMTEVAGMVAILALPGALGAAVARLVV